MKYTSEVIIKLPREKVLELFDNEENLFKWQKGLVSFEHISGEKGEEGAVSKMQYKTKKREMILQETIVKKRLPEHLNFLYETKGVKNWNDNHFIALSGNETRWTQSNVFKTKGVITVFAVIAPGIFKKQTLKSMNDFKEFAESGPQ
jgi:hypothetical protein